MRRARLILFVCLVALQVALVGTMAMSREAILDSGERVVLETRPIDPRDLFRGDYVVLTYEIELLSVSELSWVAEELTSGSAVWVQLVPTGDYHEAVSVWDEPVDIGDPMIRGTVEYVTTEQLVVDYNINEYFIPEGRGYEIENASLVDVVVAVSDDGVAVIDYLIVDGERWG